MCFGIDSLLVYTPSHLRFDHFEVQNTLFSLFYAFPAPPIIHFYLCFSLFDLVTKLVLGVITLDNSWALLSL